MFVVRSADLHFHKWSPDLERFATACEHKGDLPYQDHIDWVTRNADRHARLVVMSDVGPRTRATRASPAQGQGGRGPGLGDRQRDPLRAPPDQLRRRAPALSTAYFQPPASGPRSERVESSAHPQIGPGVPKAEEGILTDQEGAAPPDSGGVLQSTNDRTEIGALRSGTRRSS